MVVNFKLNIFRKLGTTIISFGQWNMFAVIIFLVISGKRVWARDALIFGFCEVTQKTNVLPFL